MIDPRLIGWDRWMLILQKMLLTLNVIPLSLGGLMVIAGAVVGVISFRSASRAIGPRRSGVFVVAVALLICAAFLLTVVGIFM
jgi:hypothetical protein